MSKDTEPGCQDWKVEHGVLRPQPLVLHTVCCNGRLQDRLKRATACLERKQYRLYDHESSIRSGLVKQLSDPQTVEVLGPPCHGLVNSIRRAQLAAFVTEMPGTASRWINRNGRGNTRHQSFHSGGQYVAVTLRNIEGESNRMKCQRRHGRSSMTAHER